MINDFLIKEYCNKWWNIIFKEFKDSSSFNWSYISKNPNLQMNVVLEHPEYPWDYCFMCSNPNITMDIINNNPTKYLWLNEICNKSSKYSCWEELHLNPNITMNDVINNPTIPWNFQFLSENLNLTEEMIFKRHKLVRLKNVKTKYWDWKKISNNHSLIINCIIKHPLRNWDFTLLNNNTKLTIDLILKYPTKNWDWKNITNNPNITYDMIKKNSHLPWDLKIIDLRFNKSISKKELDIIKSIKKNLNDTPYFSISNQASIFTNELFLELDIIESIEKNLNTAFYFNYLSYNPFVTIEIVKKYLDKPWNWTYLSKNMYITIKDVVENINLPWDWIRLSSNNNITSECILNNINLPWVWSSICYSRQLNMEIILKIIEIKEKLDWQVVSTNPFLTLKIIKTFEIDKNSFVINNICSNNLSFDRHNYVKNNFKKILLTKILNVKRHKKLK